jgi:hypothetical protein
LQRWWDRHAPTTETVAGLLVLMITVLVVDQVVRLRQSISRARAVGVQAAIMTTQANRASQAVSQVLAGSGDRDAAVDEFLTYTMVLLAVTPVLIDNKITRKPSIQRACAVAGRGKIWRTGNTSRGYRKIARSALPAA